LPAPRRPVGGDGVHGGRQPDGRGDQQPDDGGADCNSVPRDAGGPGASARKGGDPPGHQVGQRAAVAQGRDQADGLWVLRAADGEHGEAHDDGGDAVLDVARGGDAQGVRAQGGRVVAGHHGDRDGGGRAAVSEREPAAGALFDCDDRHAQDPEPREPVVGVPGLPRAGAPGDAGEAPQHYGAPAPPVPAKGGPAALAGAAYSRSPRGNPHRAAL
ncbi:hypothetical protein LPJ61_002340, partial [Coemansia biformis]